MAPIIRRRNRCKMTLLLGLSCFLMEFNSYAAPAALPDEAQKILEKARVQLQAAKNKAHAILKIIEPDGDIKIREMDLQTLQTDKSFKAIIRMTTPVDVKGTAVLAVIENGVQQQWLYLPSNKQVRRISSVKKSAGILGSELSPEDLNPEALQGAAVKITSKDEHSATIRLTPKAGSSEYSYVDTHFSLPESLPQKSEYFKDGVLLKTVEFLDYKNFAGNVMRAQKIRIVNVLKKRGTDIELSQINLNASFTEKDFSPEALKTTW